MFKQILAGLEELDTDIVFMAEHDVLYTPSHFMFTPTADKFYYNTNVWKIRMSDGHGLHFDCQQTSGMVAYRNLLIDEYRKRVAHVEANGYDRNYGYEPGTHEGTAESWQSEQPILDLRHDHNLTKNRWSKDEFRNKKNTAGWIEQDNIPGWGHMWHWWKRM
jgi:hypothetical protein